MDQPFDLTGYDARHTLASLVGADRTAAKAEADKLAHVVHFCDLHPVVNPDDEAATWPVDVPFTGPPADCPISGPGAPTVTVEAVHELTAALGISHGSGLNLVGQTLELRYRLPKLWVHVQDLTLPAWQGRKVAEQTMRLGGGGRVRGPPPRGRRNAGDVQAGHGRGCGPAGARPVRPGEGARGRG